MTSARHTHLEAHVNLSAVWTSARYISFLRATLKVVEPVEPQLLLRLEHRTPRPIIGASLRLGHDIRSLGGDSNASSCSTPNISSAAHAYGAAYVLLGSMLGGQVIARTLQDSLGLPDHSLTYFRSIPPIAPVWQSFTRDLDAWGAHADAEMWRDVTDTALAMFTAFETSFSIEGFA